VASWSILFFHIFFPLLYSKNFPLSRSFNISSHFFAQPHLLPASHALLARPSAAITALDVLPLLPKPKSSSMARKLCSGLLGPEAQGDKGRRKAGLSTLRALAGKPAQISCCQGSHNPRKTVWAVERACGRCWRKKKYQQTGSPGTGSGSSQLAWLRRACTCGTVSTQKGRRDRLRRCCGCFYRSPRCRQTWRNAWVHSRPGRAAAGGSHRERQGSGANTEPRTAYVEAMISAR